MMRLVFFLVLVDFNDGQVLQIHKLDFLWQSVAVSTVQSILQGAMPPFSLSLSSGEMYVQYEVRIRIQERNDEIDTVHTNRAAEHDSGGL